MCNEDAWRRRVSKYDPLQEKEFVSKLALVWCVNNLIMCMRTHGVYTLNQLLSSARIFILNNARYLLVVYFI